MKTTLMMRARVMSMIMICKGDYMMSQPMITEMFGER